MANLQQGLEQKIKELVKKGKLKEAYDLAKTTKTVSVFFDEVIKAGKLKEVYDPAKTDSAVFFDRFIKAGNLKEVYELAKLLAFHDALVQACIKNNMTLNDLADAQILPADVDEMYFEFTENTKDFIEKYKGNTLLMRLFLQAKEDETDEYMYTYADPAFFLTPEFDTEVIKLEDSVCAGSRRTYYISQLIKLGYTPEEINVYVAKCCIENITKKDIEAASLYPEYEMSIYDFYARIDLNKCEEQIERDLLKALVYNKTYKLDGKKVPAYILIAATLGNNPEKEEQLKNFMWNNLGCFNRGVFRGIPRKDFEKRFGGLKNKTPEQKSLYPYLTLSDVYKDEEFWIHNINHLNEEVLKNVLGFNDSEIDEYLELGGQKRLEYLIEYTEKKIKKEKKENKKNQLKKLKDKLSELQQNIEENQEYQAQQEMAGNEMDWEVTHINPEDDADNSQSNILNKSSRNYEELVLHILDGTQKRPEDFSLQEAVSYIVGDENVKFFNKGKGENNRTTPFILKKLITAKRKDGSYVVDARDLFSIKSCNRTQEKGSNEAGIQKSVLHYLIDLLMNEPNQDVKKLILASLDRIAAMTPEEKKHVFNTEYGDEILNYAREKSVDFYAELCKRLLKDCPELLNHDAEVSVMHNMSQVDTNTFMTTVRDFWYQDDNGNNYLHHAVMVDNFAIINKMGEQNLTFGLIHQKNKDGKTPFDLAIKKENLDTIHQLVLYGSLDNTDEMIKVIENKIKSLPEGSRVRLYLEGVEAILKQKTMPQNLDETTKKYLKNFCEKYGIEYPAQASNNSSSLSKRLATLESTNGEEKHLSSSLIYNKRSNEWIG